jgi:hypothetical protein
MWIRSGTLRASGLCWSSLSLVVWLLCVLTQGRIHAQSFGILRGFFEAPANVLEEYGQRMHGYVIAPMTGNYTFWIASDDGGELHLSADDTPARATLIASVSSWTAEREWTKEPNQESAPVRLEAGRAYYVAALMKEGGGSDNLAVRWRMPDGTDQAPMVATNLLPWGVTFTAPAIATPPADTTAVEGAAVTFRVVLSTVGPVNYQWRRNDVDIPGATAAVFELTPVRLGDDLAQFRVHVANDKGAVTSSAAVLRVTPDITRPAIARVQNLGSAKLAIEFSEPVEAGSGLDPANYAISRGIGVARAVSGGAANVVVLDTAPMTLGERYELTVNAVRDTAVTPNAIVPDTTVAFIATEYAPADVGSPPLAGADQFVALGSLIVSGSGSGLDGVADQFHFSHEVRAGSFDVKVRVALFDATDPFAMAGLVARESLEANSRFAGAFTTPAGVGSFFRTRPATGAPATTSGSFPVNYPETWLRLTRSGNTFSGYASYDGQRWALLGSVALSGMPSALYLGPAVASHSAGAAATVQFSDIGSGAGGSTGATPAPREPLGPSSRHTPLAIAEIMYHPKPQTVSNNVEFIELYNSGITEEDLTGYRLSGAIDYRFPAGTKMAAGGVLVVAAAPADLARASGYTEALGPFTNRLENGSGVVRLRNPSDAVLLEARYSGAPPWPAAADGAGHSLVLTRPSRGEADPRAWAASELIGGSPGTVDTIRPNPHANVVINEWLAHTDEPQFDFVELYNHSNASVDVSGCWLTDDPRTNKFRIPDNTHITPRGFLAFDQRQLGFALNAAGETIYLVSSNATRVLDAVRFEAQLNGVSSGRFPDGGAEMYPLAAVSPGAENLRPRVAEVVINEIYYHPISGDEDDAFVELHNRTDQPVALADWRFVDGIEYRFPSHAVIAPQGYLVVAKDRERLLANHPGLAPAAALGNFSGALADGGERLALAMPESLVSTNELGLSVTNRVYVVVDEVSYGTGGRWPSWADGGGSSLELVDPNSDHRRAPNWADSDETAKAPWSTIEFTGRLDNGHSSYPPNQLQLQLLGAGECLVDDVEVVETAAAGNLVSNPGFEAGATGWTFQGNHRASTVVTSGALTGTSALLISATGRGDTGANRIRTPLRTGLAANDTATLRARVRWRRGWPELLLRLRGNWLEAAGAMTVPKNLGTPGARNSRALANVGPALFNVTHSPVLPAANQSVVVTAQAADPDGVVSLTLRFRDDPSASTTSLTMRDDGSGGDAVAGDGIYSATIPGRAAEQLVAFYIQATDAHAAPATSRFPAAAPSREALIRWGESQPLGNLGTYRLWQRQSDFNTLRTREPLANDPLDGTFVYGNSRVIYNFEMRAKGSPFHGGSVGADYFFNFPDDDRFLGSRDMALVTVGNLGSDSTAQAEQAAFWIAQQLGAPYLHRRYVHFFENGARKGSVYEDTEEPNGEYIEAWFPDDAEGDLHKIEDWFEFADNGRDFNHVDATLQRFTTAGGGLKLARYRWDWRRRAVQDSANNYTNLFALVTAVNLSGTSYVPQVENQVDVENWMRVFALQHIVGNWDAYGYSRGKNSYLYKPTQGKWWIVPWDIDFVLSHNSDGPSTDVFGANDPVVTKMWGTPALVRPYWRAFRDAVDGPLRSEQIAPVLEARYAALRANGINVTRPDPIRNYAVARRTYLLSRLSSVHAVFAITSNAGNDLTTDRAFYTLTGTAPVSVQRIEVNGVPYPLTWPATTTWNLNLPLGPGLNQLSLVAYDVCGQPIAGGTDNINVTFTGASDPPEGFVVISEIHYNPVEPGSGFVELHNRSATTAFDLSHGFMEGTGFQFPEGTVLAPGSYRVLVNDLAAFTRVFGGSVIPLGILDGRLQDGGETLRLVLPGAAPGQERLIDQVRYDDDSPWPVDAAGRGASLQLVDPAQDNWRVANWSAVPTNSVKRATPGAINSTALALPAFPTLWINEVLPQNVAGPGDRHGDRDPWIELHNFGTDRVDLTGLYLSADYTNLTAWAFPAGITLAPGAFLLVWADNEPAQTDATELHASFRLAPGSGGVALSWMQNGAPAALDYLNYTRLGVGRSFGSYPDGQPQHRRLFHFPTPAAANNPATLPLAVTVNEWMADNTRTLADPADGDYEDWFELHNASSLPADLSGYTLTDNLTNITKFLVPDGTIIPAAGFLLVWADEEAGQTTPGTGSDLHVNFKLAATGEAIGLFAPDGTAVDTLTFAAQTNDISAGRFPDSAPAPFLEFTTATPRAPNAFASANQAPVLAPIGSRDAMEGESIAFMASATDPDAPPQNLTFQLDPGAPGGAAIDPLTGRFTWATSELDGPGTYRVTIRVRDDGFPVRQDAETITITIGENNRPPVLEPIADAQIAEGATLEFAAAASDPDVPANALRFSLEPGAPEGAAIDPITGVFSWTPGEAFGPGQYLIGVRLADSGSPAFAATREVRVTVLEVDNAPVFDPITHQSLSELAPLVLSIRARDPDAEARQVRYRLDAPPAGAAIDEVSGVLSWTPTEAQGPNSYLLRVQAAEIGGAGLASTITFGVTVDEANTAPELHPIADITAAEGALIQLTARATDVDLPQQRLRFGLDPGAPAGASIDPTSGAFSWSVGADAGASTNQVTVRVSDDASPPASAARSFQIVVLAVPRVVLNEIMYSPAALNAEFVELHNTSAATAVDLSGWWLGGAEFTFPAGSVLAPGGYLCVVKNRAVFERTYGANLPVAGEFPGQLSRDGDTIELIRPAGIVPAAANAPAGDVIDTVSYLDVMPWPPTADGRGPSLQLVDARQDNSRPANWRALTGFTTNDPQPVVTITNLWRFWAADGEPAADWIEPSYVDAAWASGRALLYVEGADLPAPKNTPLTLGAQRYFFRTKFPFTGNPSGASLRLQTVLDDGAVVYLNGRETFRLGLPEGGLGDITFANRTVSDASLEGPFTVPVDNLVSGENTLAVAVYQVNATSSDIVFGLAVDVLGVQAVAFTPGKPNSVAAALPPFPGLWINEVQSVNSSGPRDAEGEREPWLELFNAGADTVLLEGWYLTDNYSQLRKWRFPPGAALSPAQLAVIWADAEAAETTAAEWHTSFRLGASAGVVALTRDQLGEVAVVDSVHYPALASDESFASVPNGQAQHRERLTQASPGALNPAAPGSQPPTPQALEIGAVQAGADGRVAFTWTSVPGDVYRIEFTPTLDLIAWQPLATLTATAATTGWSESMGLRLTGYYRVLAIGR